MTGSQTECKRRGRRRRQRRRRQRRWRRTRRMNEDTKNRKKPNIHVHSHTSVGCMNSLYPCLLVFASDLFSIPPAHIRTPLIRYGSTSGYRSRRLRLAIVRQMGRTIDRSIGISEGGLSFLDGSAKLSLFPLAIDVKPWATVLTTNHPFRIIERISTDIQMHQCRNVGSSSVDSFEAQDQSKAAKYSLNVPHRMRKLSFTFPSAALDFRLLSAGLGISSDISP